MEEICLLGMPKEVRGRDDYSFIVLFIPQRDQVSYVPGTKARSLSVALVTVVSNFLFVIVNSALAFEFVETLFVRN